MARTAPLSRKAYSIGDSECFKQKSTHKKLLLANDTFVFLFCSESSSTDSSEGYEYCDQIDDNLFDPVEMSEKVSARDITTSHIY